MAQIVLIDIGSVQSNCSVGDKIAVHDDKTQLIGTGYATFKVVKITGMTVEEVEEKLNSLIPEQNTCFRLNAASGTFTFEQPEEKQVWKNTQDDKWRFIENHPKYAINLGLLADDIKKLKDSEVLKVDKELILLNKGRERIHLDNANQTEAVDLNGS